jgi:hypothetical protein
MKRLIVLMLLALTIVAGSAPAATQAAEQYQFAGRVVNGLWATFGENGCINTIVSVRADEGRTKRANEPERQVMVNVALAQYDVCSDTWLAFVNTDAPAPLHAVQVDHELSAATLKATVHVFDEVSGQWLPVELDLQWTAVDAPFRTKRNVQLSLGEVVLHERVDGTVRGAEAAGSVRLNGSANLTPEPSYIPGEGPGDALTYIASVKVLESRISR